MSAPNMVKFFTRNFPGETAKILKFSMREWEEVLCVNFPYVAYASLRVPLIFVDGRVIDKCCPLKYCFSPEILDVVRRILGEAKEEDLRRNFERIDGIISEEAGRNPEKYWKFVALACYCPNISNCPSEEISRISYNGPAILICPERLEERVEELQDLGARDCLKEILKAVYCHEVVHSYIDAWSTSKSPSRASFSPNKRANDFYHALLEESIATSLEVKALEEWDWHLEEIYASYLLKNLPAEYLGFHYVVNRIEDLGIPSRILGTLPERYSSEGSSPPLWSISLDLLFKAINYVDSEIIEWILRHLPRGMSFREALYYLHRYWRELPRHIYLDMILPSTNSLDLWKLAALSWMSKAPSRY